MGIFSMQFPSIHIQFTLRTKVYYSVGDVRLIIHNFKYGNIEQFPSISLQFTLRTKVYYSVGDVRLIIYNFKYIY